MNKKIKINKTVKLFFKHTWIYFALALVLFLAGLGLIEMIFPTPSTPLNFTWNGIGQFLAVAAGIGWILHGTGFLLVRA